MKINLISNIIVNIGMVGLIISFGVLFLLGLGYLVLSILGALFLICTAIMIDEIFGKENKNV